MAVIDNISTVKSLINSLTWGKLLKLVVLITILGSAIVAYDTRESIYSLVNGSVKLTPHSSMSMSKKTTDEIDKVASKSSIVFGIQVMSVDLQKNSRRIVYTRLTDPDSEALFKKFLTSNYTEFPLFTDDANNNRRLIKLINGELLCSPYKDTFSAKIMPESMKYIHTSCVISIPPAYGQFSGMLIIYLSRQPTLGEYDQIRTAIQYLSSYVFSTEFR